MRFRSIVTKFWIAILVLVVLILAVFTLTLSNRLEGIYFSHEIKLMEEHNQQWADILKRDLPNTEIQKDMEFWGSISHYVITVSDDNGNTKFTSHPNNYPHDTEMISTTLLVNINQKDSYLLKIETSKHELEEMNKATKNILITLLVFFFFLSALMALIFSRWLSKPLIAIKKATIGIVHGDFDTKLDLKRNDELGDLADSINNLSTRLKRTITTLHNTNKELNDILTQWKEFLTDVSHELRTPLFLINGYTEAILDQVVDEAKARKEYLPVIHKETLRLHKLVDDLTKIEKNTVITKQDTNLLELIKETVKPFSIVLKEKSLLLQIAENITLLPKIPLDPDKFGEVIFNLVDNALRHTPNGGTINITGEIIESGQLKLEISDTGIGINNEHLPHLFDRFYRVDKARSRSEGGTGLGLSIVKKIIDLHHGKISIASTVGKGTTFIITIPV